MNTSNKTGVNNQRYTILKLHYILQYIFPQIDVACGADGEVGGLRLRETNFLMKDVGGKGPERRRAGSVRRQRARVSSK